MMKFIDLETGEVTTSEPKEIDISMKIKTELSKFGKSQSYGIHTINGKKYLSFDDSMSDVEIQTIKNEVTK